MTGREWVVDASGCSPGALRDPQKLSALFTTMVQVLDLNPVHEAFWHQFPEPGGLTGFQVLQESHLACHTFPEHGSLCLNLFCCQPRPEFNYVFYLGREFGAESVRVRRIERPYGKPVSVGA